MENEMLRIYLIVFFYIFIGLKYSLFVLSGMKENIRNGTKTKKELPKPGGVILCYVIVWPIYLTLTIFALIWMVFKKDKQKVKTNT